MAQKYYDEIALPKLVSHLMFGLRNENKWSKNSIPVFHSEWVDTKKGMLGVVDTTAPRFFLLQRE